jgi:hypothetical protein
MISPRRLARIALHLALALSVAMPSVASLPSSMGSEHVNMNAEGARPVSESEARIPETQAIASSDNDSGCHGDHAAVSASSEYKSIKPASIKPAPIESAATVAAADDHDRDNCCGDGDCAAHGCDRAACMHLAWLPRFASLLPPPPAQTRFFVIATPPLSRHADTLLRPPIA